MARIEGRPSASMEIVLVLTEEEAGALDAIVGYGAEAFLNVFKSHLGKAYIEPYEKGVVSLFESVRNGCGIRGFLRRAQDARDVLEGRKVMP